MKAKRWSVALVPVVLCGCFQTKDELTLQADGSGTVRIETRISLDAKTAHTFGQSALGAGVMYPPADELEAQSLFPSNDFTVVVKQENTGDHESVSVVTAAFKDINALLASPYGQTHALTIQIENGVMLVKAVTGAEAAARLSEVTDSFVGAGLSASEAADVGKKKAQMRAEFRVTLPHAVSTANGTHEGKTAAWVFERAKFKDATEFAQRLGTVLEATCPADGLKLNPVTPLRLGLLPFTELAAGPGAKNGSGAVDAERIVAAVRFLPHTLRVERARELGGGKPGLPGNQARLSGEVIVPREFAPQRWGEVKLEEALDSEGNSLLPAGPGEPFQIVPSLGVGGEQEKSGEANAGSPEQRRKVTLSFKSPDWGIKELARIKASMSFQFFGGSEVVKLPQAIPAAWIADANETDPYRNRTSQPLVRHPKLRELGLVVHFNVGVAQSDMTRLILQVNSAKAALSQAQVFDSQGRPWPTFLLREDMDGGTRCTLVVAGRPQPPLSLAFLVNGVGTTVKVPIVIEHVPVREK